MQSPARFFGSPSSGPFRTRAGFAHLGANCRFDPFDVIAVISNSSREAAALADLTSSVGQPGYRCTSVRQFETLLRKAPPALVLTRLSVSDGYSDDVLSLLSKSRLLPGIAVIVLAGADCT